MEDKTPSEQIDDIITNLPDWRGRTLTELRALVRQADSSIVEEVKWKKPSKPEGVPVWSHGGIVCVADTLKSAVRLTFPKGAQLSDPKKLFNARLDGNAVRAIDVTEGSAIDSPALHALILEAVQANSSKK
jgi:hypothetical protein